ncbi:hypothetical protein AB0K49_30725 [Streptomyces decoyicus]|uniref:hypothetical protein n=1 Tax=Streptomyces decoyicus TaxID=249567 RepID=UPI00345CD3DC
MKRTLRTTVVAGLAATATAFSLATAGPAMANEWPMYFNKGKDFVGAAAFKRNGDHIKVQDMTRDGNQFGVTVRSVKGGPTYYCWAPIKWVDGKQHETIYKRTCTFPKLRENAKVRITGQLHKLNTTKRYPVNTHLVSN